MYRDKQTEEEEKKREGSRAGARLYRPSSEENSVNPEESSVVGGRIPEEANFSMRPELGNCEITWVGGTCLRHRLGLTRARARHKRAQF